MSTKTDNVAGAQLTGEMPPECMYDNLKYPHFVKFIKNRIVPRAAFNSRFSGFSYYQMPKHIAKSCPSWADWKKNRKPTKWTRNTASSLMLNNTQQGDSRKYEMWEAVVANNKSGPKAVTAPSRCVNLERQSQALKEARTGNSCFWRDCDVNNSYAENDADSEKLYFSSLRVSEKRLQMSADMNNQ